MTTKWTRCVENHSQLSSGCMLSPDHGAVLRERWCSECTCLYIGFQC